MKPSPGALNSPLPPVRSHFGSRRWPHGQLKEAPSPVCRYSMVEAAQAKQLIKAFHARMQLQCNAHRGLQRLSYASLTSDVNDGYIFDFLKGVGGAAETVTRFYFAHSQVTDVGIEALAKNCTSMITITICFCDKVTDAGVEALSKCTSLEHIHLEYCGKVTATGIEALVKNCTSLTKLTCASLFVSQAMRQTLESKGIKVCHAF